MAVSGDDADDNADDEKAAAIDNGAARPARPAADDNAARSAAEGDVESKKAEETEMTEDNREWAWSAIGFLRRSEDAGAVEYVATQLQVWCGYSGGSHIRQTAFSQLIGARNIFRVVRNSNPEVRTARLPFQVVSLHPRSR